MLTAISMSAIATNGMVPGEGAAGSWEWRGVTERAPLWTECDVHPSPRAASGAAEGGSQRGHALTRLQDGSPHLEGWTSPWCGQPLPFRRPRRQ